MSNKNNGAAKVFGKIFKKFHLLIFFIFTVGFLSFAVVITSQIITGEPTQSIPTTSIPQGNNPDTSVLQKIESLKPSSEPSEFTVPAGARSNPFAE